MNTKSMLDMINNTLHPPVGFLTARNVDAAMMALSLDKSMITHEIAIKAAMQLAYWSVLNGGGPFGAVIVKNGRIISYGANHVVKHSDPTDHGEVNAIRRAVDSGKEKLLQGATLYSSTYPCPMCCGLAIDQGIAKIVYCNTDFDAQVHGGFKDQVIWEKVNGVRIVQDASVSFFALDGHRITVQNHNGQPLEKVLRDYCQKYGFEPKKLMFDGKAASLSLFEYAALCWAGICVSQHTQLKAFYLPEIILDDQFQIIGQQIFQLFKCMGHEYGQELTI